MKQKKHRTEDGINLIRNIVVGMNSRRSNLEHTDKQEAVKTAQKAHKEETKELMRQAALGRKYSDETLLKMSIIRGLLHRPLIFMKNVRMKGLN